MRASIVFETDVPSELRLECSCDVARRVDPGDVGFEHRIGKNSVVEVDAGADEPLDGWSHANRDEDEIGANAFAGREHHRLDVISPDQFRHDRRRSHDDAVIAMEVRDRARNVVALQQACERLPRRFDDRHDLPRRARDRRDFEADETRTDHDGPLGLRELQL